MSYLGYKNIAYRKHMRERRLAVEKERKLNAKRTKQLYKATIAHVVIAIMLIALYSLVFVTSSKADTIKVGDGAFVMAVSVYYKVMTTYNMLLIFLTVIKH